MAVLSLSCLLHATSAHAQPSGSAALAESLFEDGRALMGKKDFAHACPKLEESLRIEATGPTLFVLADCLEQAGRTASAWARWREARDYARTKGKSDKEQEASRRAAALEGKFPKIRIDVAPAVASLKGLEVKLDGVVVSSAVFGSELPRDPGDVIVEVSATGKKPLVLRQKAAPGPVIVLAVTSLVDAPVAKTDTPPATIPTTPSPPGSSNAPDTTSPPHEVGSTQRTVGLVVGGVGLGGVALGGIFMILATSTQSKINSSADCTSAIGCSDLISKRDGQVTVGIIGLAAGGAAVIGGTVIYLTAPRATQTGGLSSLRLTASPTPSSPGVWLQGAW